MKRLSILFAIAFALITTIAVSAIAADKSAVSKSYKAELSGQAEVPTANQPAVATDATGEAIFRLGGKEAGGAGTGGTFPSGEEYGLKESQTGKGNVDPYYKGIIDQSGSATGGTASDVLHYQLNVNNIEDVTAAHLHMGKTGTAEGPVIAPLYTGGKKAGPFSGTLAEGTITAKDLKGPMSGKSVQDLARLMDRGEVYVNVHTAKHPAGEIRGEVTPEK